MDFFKRNEWRVLVRVLALFVTITISCLIIIKGWYVYLVVMIPVIIAQLIDFYKLQRKAHDELKQFVESVHYRDFSRYFDVKHAPVELQPLRQGFNEINTTIKGITRERETQYQYLQKILELIDTGILMYREDDGTVMWMNEALKNLLQLPYLKTIHSLERRDKELYIQVEALRPGDSKIGTAHLDKAPFKVLLSATAFQTDGVKYKLIAFQNVNEALDETESKAWQKLLSVMTHEIMNSIAPISSLAATLKGRLHEAANELSATPGALDDLELGIDTIKRRSEGLLKFAETYRNLNKITAPNLRKVYVRDLFENLYNLMLPTLLQKKIELEINLKDPDLMLDADTNLVEQVLINLVVNAMEAVKDKHEPHIILSGYLASNRKTVIRVSDNGSGMSEEVLEKIFIPFFSTKKSGSGIGLSLCKQIMMLHRGHIQVQSVEGEGTAFILQF
ncbi:HAMP domain-containing histidine kinase [Pseudoflavitalea sp. G-6-1-2]|uniref:sensor histidine kinase n=1 Tax=Pseudoflavitalea sp. G-6-1-2 TaxID=2728841 RepID=UPI00146D04CA|nr:HAMP domain-containing sensor histidine kinase [Pseudoflavitalea sp. G-6-1-2]NML23677.1 HAMP domain-containing histidine kinase [Pseudoflavitalea sp. G-6-1-2]